jgi:hypothetical protein
MPGEYLDQVGVDLKPAPCSLPQTFQFRHALGAFDAPKRRTWILKGKLIR